MTQQFPPRYIPKRNKKICPHENLHMNVHGSITRKSQKVKITQIASIGEWLNIAAQIYSYDEILLSNEKAQTIDTHREL